MKNIKITEWNDIASISRVNPYQSEMELFYLTIGLYSKPEQSPEQIYWKERLADTIAMEWAKEKDIEPYKENDAFQYSDPKTEEECPLLIRTCDQWSWDNGIKNYFRILMEVAMHDLKAPAGEMAILVDGYKFHTLHYKADERNYDVIAAKVRAFEGKCENAKQYCIDNQYLPSSVNPEDIIEVAEHLKNEGLEPKAERSTAYYYFLNAFMPTIRKSKRKATKEEELLMQQYYTSKLETDELKNQVMRSMGTFTEVAGEKYSSTHLQKQEGKGRNWFHISMLSE